MLVADRAATSLFEETVAAGAEPAAAANWITQDLAALQNRAGDVGVEGDRRTISWTCFGCWRRTPSRGPARSRRWRRRSRPAIGSTTIVERRGLAQVSDTGELGAIADRVIADNPDAAAKFRSGNEGVIGFLVGQVMKASGGSANPKLAQELLRERLTD